MFSLAKMSSASQDYYLGLVQYYLGGRRRKRKKLKPGLPDDPEEPAEEGDADGLALGDPLPYSTALPGEPPGRWFGQGAAALGLSGIVEEEPYRRIFRGYHPFTAQPLVQNAGAADRRPGWEACFSPPKDFSVLWSQATPEVRSRLEELHWDAATATLRLIEQSFAFSRAGKAGCQSVPVGLVVPMFEDASSRAGDPDLHIHAPIQNLGIDANGQARALDPLPLFRNQQLFGAFYRARLAANLRREFGIRAERSGRSFTLPGVPQDLVRQHSKRRQQILAQLQKRGERGAKAAAIAALETRPEKDPLVSRDELFQRWRSTNIAAGFDDAQVARLLRHGPRKAATTLPKVIQNAVRELTRAKNHFTHQDLLLQTLWELPRHGLDPEGVPAAVSEYLQQSGQIVPLGTADGLPRYTTTDVLREEQRMLSALGRLMNRPGLNVPQKRVQRQLRKRPTMRKEQADFVRRLTQTHSALRIGLGYAGTGKTYALKTCVDAWRRQGYRVLAAAPTGQAARVLGREIGANCTTLTRLLGDFRLPFSAAVSHHARQLVRAARGQRTRPFRQPRPAHVTRNTIILVDEAGMIGTRHMRMLAELAERNGATLCLVGDPAQLPAVETTSPLQSLVSRYGAARLTEIRRQKELWAREAAQAMARGEPGTALAMFAERNRITVRDDLLEAVQQACLDWTAEGLHTPHRAIILANTNELVHLANHLCQEHRLRARCIDPSLSVRIVDEQSDARWESPVHVGDRVLFTKNSQQLGVENGSLGTVLAIRQSPSQIRVVLDDGRRVTVDVRRFPHVRLGYAATTHKSQGASIPKVHVILGGNLQNLPASYVQATRAVEDTHFYTAKDLLSPYLDQVKNSPLAEEMARKPDLRLASDFLGQAPLELRRRRSKIRRVASASPNTVRDARPSESRQPHAAPPITATSPSSTGTGQNHPAVPPGSASRTSPRPQPQEAQTPTENHPASHALAAQLPPQPATSFDGTYQRLRLPSGLRYVANGCTLVASCVDGGLTEHRHRPPPPRGMAMPFAADSVIVQRVSPTPGPRMRLSEAHRRGMFTLIGTGCQDHVQVFCRPEERWQVVVTDSLGLISPQDDIAGGLAFFNKPPILMALDALDRLDDRLRDFSPTQTLLRSLFGCLRRQAAWLMPHVPDPAAVNRDFLARFCRMLFEDPCSRYLIQQTFRMVQPSNDMYPRQLLACGVAAPYSLPAPLLDDLLDALVRQQPEGPPLTACFRALAQQISPAQRQSDLHACCQSLAESVAAVKRYLANCRPTHQTQWQLMQTLYGASQQQVPSGAEFLGVLTHYLPITHDLIVVSPAIRHLWLYITAYLNGEEAKAAELYQSFAQSMASQTEHP